jgi:hypothetical protein
VVLGGVEDRGRYRSLPDHEFVITTALVMVGIRSSENVVSNVGANVARLVVPLDVGGHALDLAHVQASRELLANIGVTLNIVLATLPRPAGGPADAGSGGALDGGALAAGAGGALAPVVVVELVAVGCVVGVLRAEGCCLAADRSHRLLDRSSNWASSGQGQKACESASLEQHIERMSRLNCDAMVKGCLLLLLYFARSLPHLYSSTSPPSKPQMHGPSGKT